MKNEIDPIVQGLYLIDNCNKACCVQHYSNEELHKVSHQGQYDNTKN